MSDNEIHQDASRFRTSICVVNARVFRGPQLYSMTSMVRIRIDLDNAAADDLEHLALHHDRPVFINADARTRGFCDTAPMTWPGALPSSPWGRCSRRAFQHRGR
ncbi:hypothetical protein [Mesorhizobium sp. CO1-1-8]|uniref:hypothetical protein n=1 Tax=Mesorhizobium sp. CO1-1-8 TaxID=2876631 RepID=UPI001CD16FFE|nr:hypothetical protein [Mesorhizobium sp. CO1-1-8]MBZ9774975.1 hypothetical protein [Mesorhizobium sp. CO1-1-8]